jgi:hypothetical protein
MYGSSTPLVAQAAVVGYGAPQISSVVNYGAPQTVSVSPVVGYGVPQTTVVGSYGVPQTTVVGAAVVGGYGVPRVSAARAAPETKSAQDKLAELQYYKELGERQARQHKVNAKIVSESAQDLSRVSLVNRLVAGTGNTAPWFPPLRLFAQKDVADAYKSEKRIANKNAEDAFRRFQEDPSKLNLLVSKYQDLNADLRDAAYHYNVVNAATFGQQIQQSTNIFNLGSTGVGGLTQIITQKKQSEDLQEIQRQMQRVSKQIQAEANAIKAQAAATKKAAPQQGSVQQRMMAIANYGPQPRSG